MLKERYTLLNILHYIQPGQSVSNTWDYGIDTRGKYQNKMSQKLHRICHLVNNALSTSSRVAYVFCYCQTFFFFIKLSTEIKKLDRICEDS